MQRDVIAACFVATIDEVATFGRSIVAFACFSTGYSRTEGNFIRLDRVVISEQREGTFGLVDDDQIRGYVGGVRCGNVI